MIPIIQANLGFFGTIAIAALIGSLLSEGIGYFFKWNPWASGIIGAIGLPVILAVIFYTFMFITFSHD